MNFRLVFWYPQLVFWMLMNRSLVFWMLLDRSLVFWYPQLVFWMLMNRTLVFWMLLDCSLVFWLCIGMLIRSCHCECVLVIYDLVRKVVRKTPVSEYVLRVGRLGLGAPPFPGRPVGRYYRPMVALCLNGQYSWICGRYYIKMVDILSKNLSEWWYDISQDLSVLNFKKWKWEIGYITVLPKWACTLWSRKMWCCKYMPFKELLWSIFGWYLVDIWLILLWSISITTPLAALNRVNADCQRHYGLWCH